MKSKINLDEYEKLVSVRERQLSSLKNIPNKLEVVGEIDGCVVINNASSTDIESALEAISAIKERVVWITEMDYSSINFHGILGGITDGLDMLIHVGDNNPFENFGKASVSCSSLQEAIELGVASLENGAYLVYAPANSPEKTIKERGENFRNLIQEKLK